MPRGSALLVWAVPKRSNEFQYRDDDTAKDDSRDGLAESILTGIRQEYSQGIGSRDSLA